MDDTQSLDPEVLVADIRNGSKQAEASFARKYWKGLVIMMEQRTGDRVRAEDIAQETVAVVLTKLRAGALDNPTALTSYVQQTAKFIHIGQQRRRDNQLELVGEMSALFEADGTLVEACERLELTVLVRNMLSEVRLERDRDLLLRYYVHDQPKPAICVVLDLSSEQFDRVLHRARKRFVELAGPRLRDGIGSEEESQ